MKVFSLGIWRCSGGNRGPNSEFTKLAANQSSHVCCNHCSCCSRCSRCNRWSLHKFHKCVGRLEHEEHHKKWLQESSELELNRRCIELGQQRRRCNGLELSIVPVEYRMVQHRISTQILVLLMQPQRWKERQRSEEKNDFYKTIFNIFVSWVYQNLIDDYF